MGLLDLNAPRGHCHTNVAGFVEALPELLGSMAVDPRCFIVVAEFADNQYVQFWIEVEGDMTVETSPAHGSSRSPLARGVDERLLGEVGWLEPEDAGTPNWWVAGEGPSFILDVITMTEYTVGHLLDQVPSDPVFIHFWTRASDDASSDRVRLEARVSYHNALRTLRRDLDGA
ncbi:MAG: TY-Chap domain-containing protein [Acidimicrobiales bacterium]